MHKTILLFLLLTLLFIISPGAAKAQSEFGAGVYAGGGSLGGNFVSQGSFNTSLYIEFKPIPKYDVKARLSFIYATDVNVLQQNSPSRYTPNIRGFALKGIILQSLSGLFYLEEGLGPVAVNDRTLLQTNAWDYGIAFSLVLGIDLRGGSPNGFKLGAGTDYGMTFTNTDVRYAALYLQLSYTF